MRLPGFRLVHAVYHAIRSPEARGLAWARLTGPRLVVFQPFGTSRPDRHADVFGYVKDQLGSDTGLRLLSFGCSTGDELFSLRALFPSATVRGLDVNPYNIRKCQDRLSQAGSAPGISVAVADSTKGEPSESYDAIFAMAVFRHGLLDFGADRCDDYLRFADFERAVNELARCLKPGGLLVIRYAHLRFRDTAAFRGFEEILPLPPTDPTKPAYGPNHCRLPPGQVGDGVFRKLPAPKAD
ncbi:MAG TPA: class I SAM-dependent methyltransferase [Magnetospirillum sp.]|nr:class I SAM-dependent methyltransferase [Magnetospirillum sp.]